MPALLLMASKGITVYCYQTMRAPSGDTRYELLRSRVRAIYPAPDKFLSAPSRAASGPLSGRSGHPRAGKAGLNPSKMTHQHAQPGGNLTGINFLNSEVTAKRMALLRELVPTAARIVLLGTPTGALGDAAL